jgi:hypothetical protein
VRTARSTGQLGSALAVLPRAFGDAIVIGAPARLVVPPAASTDAGRGFVVGAATLRALPSLQILDGGAPAQAVYEGAAAGDAFGGAFAIGDFDRDQILDLAVAGDHGVTLYYGPLP